MQRILIVAGAGALGCVLRYLVSTWATERFGPGFPVGTLIVNVTGCFLIALVMELSLDVATISPDLRLGLTAGFLGGLTTYSSFNYETTQLALDGAFGRAALNFAGTALACFAAGLAGLFVARRIAGA